MPGLQGAAGKQADQFIYMKRSKILLLAILVLYCVTAAFGQQLKRVLVFSKTLRYYHESIPAGIAAIQQLGRQYGFLVDSTTNSRLFTEENLKQYAALIFLSPGGDVFDTVQQAELERYIQAGGGFVGIHGASTVEYDWPWYGRLVGAYFDGHPEPQQATVLVADSQHLATRHLPREWRRFDEWYNFKNSTAGLKVLLTVRESDYRGGKQGAYHPVAWYHAFDGGRSFYTALGHFDEAYSDPLFLQHLWGGIQYAMGKGTAPDYSRARTKRINP